MLYHNAEDAEIYVRSKVAVFWAQFRTVFRELPIEPPRVTTVIKDTRVAGYAFYNLDKGVEYNLAYCMSHKDMCSFDRTIAHELAHVIQFRLYPNAKQAHGTEFRMILDIMGFDSSTCNRYSRKAASVAVREHNSDDNLLKELGL